MTLEQIETLIDFADKAVLAVSALQMGQYRITSQLDQPLDMIGSDLERYVDKYRRMLPEGHADGIGNL